MQYSVVTGFYPSEKSAEKVLQKARAVCKDSRIEPYYNGYCVVLFKTDDKKKAVDFCDDCNILRHLFCGIIDNLIK